jgi:hypothetical protein
MDFLNSDEAKSGTGIYHEEFELAYQRARRAVNFLICEILLFTG